jgi:hypothetical protein
MPQILERLRRSGLDVEKEIDPPTWGQAKLRVFEGVGGRYVLKSMGHSSFAGLPNELVNELFDALYECTSHLLLPVRVEQGYVLEVAQEPSMVFPWVGARESHQPSWHLELLDHVRFIAKLDEEFARVPRSLVDRLVDEMFFIQVTPAYLEEQLSRCRAILEEDLEEEILKACEVWASRPLTTSRYSKLAHTDLHASNLVKHSDARLIAIDIDGMRVGDEYADLILVLASRGVSLEYLPEALASYRDQRLRALPALTVDSILVGVALALSWLVSVSLRVGPIIQHDMRERMTPAARSRAVEDVSEKHRQLGGALVRGVDQMNRGLSSILRLASN